MKDGLWAGEVQLWRENVSMDKESSDHDEVIISFITLKFVAGLPLAIKNLDEQRSLSQLVISN